MNGPAAVPAHPSAKRLIAEIGFSVSNSQGTVVIAGSAEISEMPTAGRIVRRPLTA
jgi:hypothetical protein